ncbi:MAG: hypothetical protein RLY86_2742 [Pseudomonadota bacterium]|jgi:hypothetical protein
MPDSLTVTNALGCGRGLVAFFDGGDLTEPTLPPRETGPWAMLTGQEIGHGWSRSQS